MNDVLEELLRSTDAANPPPARTCDVVPAVKRRRSQRRRVRVATASFTSAALLVAAAVALLREPPRPRPAPLAVAPMTPPIELNPETRVRIHEMTIQALQARRAQRRSAERIAAVASTPSPRELRDRAALILIYDAEQHRRARRRDDAVAAYRRTIDLFPQSPWADVARQRLKQI